MCLKLLKVIAAIGRANKLIKLKEASVRRLKGRESNDLQKSKDDSPIVLALASVFPSSSVPRVLGSFPPTS